MQPYSVPLALSVGDPSGIGPEIAIEAWRKRGESGVPPFYLLADPALIAARAKTVGIDISIVEADPSQAVAAFHNALPILPLAARFTNTPGQPDIANAAGTIEAIEKAVADRKSVV